MWLLVNIIIVIFLWSPQSAIALCVQGDCINGQGTFVLPDGRRYVGEFVNGVRHGQGSFESDDGKIYIGQWQKDLPHGKGRLIYPGREDFFGQFVNGLRNGQGEATYTDGTRYKGQWSDDLPNGKGTKVMPDGIQYSGEFKNGLMYGRSKMIMPDGNQVNIQWQNEVISQQEEEQPESVSSSALENEDWAMFSTPKEKQSRQSPVSQKTSEQKIVALQDLSGATEAILPQKDTPIEAAEYISPQTFKKKPLIVEEQTQRKAVKETKIEKEKELTPETAMSDKGEQASGPQDIHAQTAAAKKAESEYVSIANVAKGANIRSAASLTSEVLRAVPSGFPLIVLERQEDWVLVEDFRKRKGWVNALLLSEIRTGIIKVWKANLRSGPSLNDEIIEELDYGTVISVVDDRGDWLQVGDSKKMTGWLYHKVIWP